MKCINTITISGRVVTEPRQVFDDPLAVQFRIANYEKKKKRVKNSDEFQYITEKNFTNVKCWNRTAQFVLDFIKKNDYVVCHGSLNVFEKTYEDENGNQQSARNFEIIARDVLSTNFIKENNIFKDDEDTKEKIA